MSHYKITSSLTAAGERYKEIEFLGCDAEIAGNTSTCYFVKFYVGLPFMIGKNKFQVSATPQQEPTKLDPNMIIADVTLRLGSEIKKTYRTVLPPDDPNYQSVKRNALTWFKMSEGVHYDSITHEQITEISTTIKSTTKMAKSKATTTDATENATTGVVLFEDQAKKVNLPAIPKVMTIGGVEFSEAAIKKEVDAVKKIKLEIILPTDTVEVAEAKRKVYEELDEKRKKFVKTRTQPEAFRKETSKPVTDWAKSLKAQTDAYGNLAKEGELHCAEQIESWDNHEAEQKRIEDERIQKLVDSRTADLQSVYGILNRDSLHWTFAHTPSKLVENSFLEEADDSEWNGLMKELEGAVAAEKEAQAERDKEFEATKNALYNTRIQMLQLLGGYEKSATGDYTKNGHTLTDEQIRNTPETDWMSLITSHNKVKEVVNPFARTTDKDEPMQSQPAAASNNPFGIPAAPVAEDKLESKSSVPHTIWDKTFVEQQLGKTYIRMFAIENEQEAMKGVGEVVYQGRFDVNLIFVIYK